MTSAVPPDAAGEGAMFVTPSQTVGPFFGYALPYDTGPEVVAPGTPGAFRLHGGVFDGNGEPVPDALVEIWQPDSRGELTRESGIYHASSEFRGFGRCGTDDGGHYWFRTVKPGSVRTADGRPQAPHLAVTVFARGLLRQLFTRVYFPDEVEANAADPLLADIDPGRRTTLVAEPDGEGGLHFDVRLQDQHGDKETVFLDVFGSG